MSGYTNPMMFNFFSSDMGVLFYPPLHYVCVFCINNNKKNSLVRQFSKQININIDKKSNQTKLQHKYRLPQYILNSMFI